MIQELQHLVVRCVLVCERGEGIVTLQNRGSLDLLSVPGGELYDVGNTDHAVAAIPVSPERKRVLRISLVIFRMCLVNCIKRVEQPVKVLDVRLANLLVTVPAKKRCGINKRPGIGQWRRIRHLAGDAVDLPLLNSIETFIEDINLLFIRSQVRILVDIRGDILDQACTQAVIELGTVKDHDIAEIARGGTRLVYCITCHLRCDNIDLDIQVIFQNLCKPSGLLALIVCSGIIDLECHFLVVGNLRFLRRRCLRIRRRSGLCRALCSRLCRSRSSALRLGRYISALLSPSA